MALNTLSDISAVLAERFGEGVTKTYNRAAITATKLAKRDGEGKALTWRANVGGMAAAAAFTQGAAVADSDLSQDTYVAATLPWAQYRTNFGVSGLELAAVQSDSGALDIIAEYIDDAAKNLARVVNGAIFSGNGSSLAIAGLAGASAVDSTGTYAGVDRSTYSTWASSELGNGGTDRELTKALMDELESSIFTASDSSPDLIVCSPAVAKKYEGLFDQVVRVSADGRDLAPAIGDMGYTGRNYRGIPVFRDSSCTAKTLYMLNTGEVMIRPLREGRTSPNDSVGSGTVSLAGLGIHIEALAKVGDGSRFSLVWRGQLQVKNPNTCGKIVDIAV